MKKIRKYKVGEHMKGGLDFPDLPLRSSNGFTKALHLGPGEFVPDDLLEEKDFKLSESFGCIKNALRAGWLIDITAPIVKKEPVAEHKAEAKTKPNYSFVEVMGAEDFAKMRDNTGTVSVMPTNGPQPAVQVESIKFNGSMPIVEQAVVSTKDGNIALAEPEKRGEVEEIKKEEAVVDAANKLPNTLPGSNGINSYLDFQRLTHFAKLDFIKITSSSALLNEIVQNSDQKQLVNNARGRLRDLGQTV